MAESHGMIEPFEPGQIKLREGNKLISYGTSSYGYDVRCAREFKIFTNINSTIVDPKSFDPSSFVDVERSEEHTSELQSLMRISYAVFCLNKKNQKDTLTEDTSKSKTKR